MKELRSPVRRRTGPLPRFCAGRHQTERVPERTVLVTTQLDNAGGLLKPEMTGHAKIHGDRRRLIELVARRFVRFIRVEFWSWW